MKKKLISVLLALVVVIGLTVLGVAAEDATSATHADHCVCGGQEVGGEHTCETLTGWTAFDKSLLIASSHNQSNYMFGTQTQEVVDGETVTTTTPTAQAYYYLTEDVTLDKSVDIFQEQNITICLNGHKLTSKTGTSAKRIFRINGTLNITDCSEKQTGSIVGTSSQAPVFYAYAHGQVNLYAGTLSSVYKGTANYWGGICALATTDKGTGTTTGPSTFTMYGGKLIGHDVVLDANGKNGIGGAVQIFHESNFYMYGGEIVGAHAENTGGAVNANTSGTVSLLGGKISGGSAGNKGTDVWTSNETQLTIGNDMQVGEVYINQLGQFTTQNFTGSVGLDVHLANGNVLTTTATLEEAERFTEKMASRDLQITEVDGQFQVKLVAAPHDAHCECGGNLTGDAKVRHEEDGCTVIENWIPLSQADFVLSEDNKKIVESDTATSGTAGNYMFGDDYDTSCFYLTENITITYPLEIHNDDDVTICLNGFQMKYDTSVSTTKSLLRVFGKLNVCDCTGEGILASASKGEAAVAYLLNGRGSAELGFEFNLYGGNLKAVDGDSTKKGGVMQIGNSGSNPGTFNMYGGTVTGGTAYAGGNIFIERLSCAMYMYGGTVSGGTVKTLSGQSTSNRGGNIYVNGGQFYMYGGTVTGGKTTSGTNVGYGADIYQHNLETSVVYLDCTIGDLKYGFSGSRPITIGENLNATGTVTYQSVGSASYYLLVDGGATKEMAEHFVPVDTTTHSTLFSGGNLYEVSNDVRVMCRCGGQYEGNTEWHSCSMLSTWLPLNAEVVLGTLTDVTDETTGETTQQLVGGLEILEGDGMSGTCYILPAGNYYLTEDLSIDHSLLVQASNNVVIDLNGYNLTGTANAERALTNRGTLYITDSAYDADAADAEYAVISGSNETEGYQALYNCGSSKAYLYGGCLASSAEKNANGTVGNSGEFRIFGGEIRGCTVTGSGAAIVHNDSGKTYMYYGTIYGAQAKQGGAIAVMGVNQRFNMYGGVVTGGNATNYGGNIYCSRGQVTISGGEVSNGYAAISGGNVYLAAGIASNTPFNGKLVMSGGTIKDGAVALETANRGYGANIYANAASGTYTKTVDGVEQTLEYTRLGEIEISGGEILGGKGRTGGSIYCKGKMTLSGGTISGGEATSAMGGNIRIEAALSEFYMTGGTVTEGRSVNQGGNIVAYKAGSVEITGGTISNGYAATNGGNIYLGNSSASISGVTITGGETNSSGGNIGVSAGYKLTLDNVTISGGKARLDGGNIACSDLEMTSGTVSGGTCGRYGGNIYLFGEGNISGGTITGGVSTSETHSGGNICASGVDAVLNLSGTAVVSNGTAREGGNISMRQNGTVNILGGTVVGGNAAAHGGNIVVFGTLNVSGGVIKEGVAVQRGGNISGHANTCNITITGGQIIDGIVTGVADEPEGSYYGNNIVMNTDDDNIPVLLTITGGEIGGKGQGCLEDVYSVHILSSGMEIITTVGGTAKIDSLRLGTGRMLQVAEGGFSEDAYIGISRFEIAGLFGTVADKAYANYFAALDEGVSVETSDYYTITNDVVDEEGNVTGTTEQTVCDLILVSENPYWAFTVNNDAIAPAATIMEAAAIEGAGYVKLIHDYETTEVITGEIYLDLYGNKLSGLVVNGKLNVIDNANNTYEAADCGTISFTLGEEGSVAQVATTKENYAGNVSNYVLLANEDGTYSAHRLYVNITSLSLKPSDVSFGYKAAYKADEVLSKLITGYGYRLGIDGYPAHSYTSGKEFVAGNEGNVLTLRVKNILAEGDDDRNTLGATAVINGAAFVTLNIDGEAIVVNSTMKSYSLKDMIEAIDTAIGEAEEGEEVLDVEQLAAVQAMINKFSAYMTDWSYSNIVPAE